MEIEKPDSEPRPAEADAPKKEVDKPDSEPRVAEADPLKKDEFAYIERQGFTGEIFKIEIKNLPKYYGVGELKNLLNNKLAVNPSKIKVVKPGCRYAFVCFRDEEGRKKAIEKLNGYKWKGNSLIAFDSKPSPDPLARKRNQESQGQGAEPKKRKTLAESTTPLAHLPYEDQLFQKQSEARNVLLKLGNEFWKASGTKTRDFIAEQRRRFDGLPAQLLDVKPSPELNGYRNKCEFSIGKNEAGETVVGFRVGSYANGFTEVGPVDDLLHIPDAMKKAVRLFQDFVRGSKLGVFNHEDHTGHFRQLLARLSRKSGELMLAVGIHPQDLTEEQLKSFQDDFVTFFTTGAGKEANVSCLFYQEMKKRESGQMVFPTTHLHGPAHITDELLGLRFRISPTAFFQINSAAAEVLYRAAIDLAAPDPRTILLDVCCGTGTIGLCFAGHCKRVLGVEIIEQAVRDAEENARENGVANARFTAANCDDWIRATMRSEVFEADDRVVAVVDPPRAGLHARSIQQIRNCERIERLVYIACSPASAVKNWVDLCRPCSKTMSGDPFVPVKAVPVDLFPHTPHLELVLLFERKKEEETPKEVETSAVENSEDQNIKE